MSVPTEFVTSDLYFAAALQTIGIPLLRAENQGKRVAFVFDATDEDTHNLEKEWKHGGLEVDAPLYADRIKKLRGVLHSLWETDR